MAEGPEGFQAQEDQEPVLRRFGITMEFRNAFEVLVKAEAWRSHQHMYKQQKYQAGYATISTADLALHTA